MRGRICVICTVAALLLLCQSSPAELLRTLAYQGVLTDTLGNPKPDGSYTFTFRLYGAISGGTALWTETKTLEVKKGLFSTLLGDEVLLGPNLKFNTQYWLTLQVGSDPELTPRILLSTVGYSLRSRMADTADYARDAVVPGLVDSAQLALTVPDATITSAKIQNGTIQFADIGQNGATDGQVIKWNGSAWTAQADASAGGSGGWTDGGRIVELATSSDSVALGTTLRLGKLNVGGPVAVGGILPRLFFGDYDNHIGGAGGDMMFVTKDWTAAATGNIAFAHYGDEVWVTLDNTSKRFGIGTASPVDRLHVVNDDATSCWMRVETSHPTNWGQAGLRIRTPQNMWNLRMDTYTNANLQDGALSLYSQDGGKEAMTWLEDGKVGIGTVNPTRKLHVYGSAQVKDTLYANAISVGKIIQGPGLASTGGVDGVVVGSTYQIVASVTIQAPTAGYVLVSCSGAMYADHTYGDYPSGTVALSTSSSWNDNFGWTSSDFDKSCPSGVYFSPFGLQGVAHVTAAGSYTYHLIGKRSPIDDHDAVTLYTNALTALFIPNAYGTVNVTAAFSPPAVERQVDSAASSSESLESRVNRLTLELQAVRSELASQRK